MRIFFLASDNQLPSGGLKFIYRFCELANEIGYNAAVMHGQSMFRVDKFTYEAPVVFNYSWQKMSRRQLVLQHLQRIPEQLLSTSRESIIQQDDIVVVPENRLFRIHEIFPGTRKILLNQNAFLAAGQGMPKSAEDIIGSISTSDLCFETICRLMPNKTASFVPLWLSPQLFTPTKAKKCQIAYMPRRNAQDARIVFNLLAASNATAGMKIVPIVDMTLDQVAETLRESLMFLSFADREGFGLPAAEAIASGCLTIGYTGIGGDEFFLRFGAWPIAQQNILAFADTVASILRNYDSNPRSLDAVRLKNASDILNYYNKSASKTALRTALISMIGGPDSQSLN